MCYMYTESGVIDSRTILPVMRQFISLWKAGHSVNSTDSAPSSTVCWVLSDRLAAHRSPPLLEMMLMENFEPWSLPGNVTYFASPLDLEVYGSFHNLDRALNEKHAAAAIRIDENWRQLLPALAKAALQSSFTKETLRLSFETTAVWPWDKSKFLERGREYLLRSFRQDLSRMGVNSRSIKNELELQRELDRSLVEEVTKKTVPIRVEVEERTLFSGREMYLQHLRRQALVDEKKARATEDEVRKRRLDCGRALEGSWKEFPEAKRLCMGPSCGSRWRGGTGWRTCECGDQCICPACRKSMEKAGGFVEHSEKCQKK